MDIDFKENDNNYDNSHSEDVVFNREFDSHLKGYEWCNELLSFPQLFNQVFLSIYKYNEYIDKKWSILTDTHAELFNLLIELSKRETKYTLEPITSNIEIVERCIQNNSDIYNQQVVNKSTEKNIQLEINIQSEFNDSNTLNNQDEFKKLYNDSFNRYLTCKNDIEITFERKTEMIMEVYSRLKKIISSIELFINNNQDLLESHTKPLYNISNHEITDMDAVNKKSSIRGRPPGTGNRGRPIGSTKKIKKGT